MKKFTLLYILLALLTLSSCGHSDSKTLKVAGSFSVPGMYYGDLKGMGSVVEILETDSEGRTLFYYTTDNAITGNRETAIVICQKYNSRYVYFYEDRCYLISNYEQSDIELLKQQNDWNAPLDESKMSVRQYKLSFGNDIRNETHLSTGRVRTRCSQILKIDKSRLRMGMVDRDPQGNYLYWLSADEERIYIVLATTSYKVVILEIKNDMDISTKLAEFKQNNGWVYGY